MYSLKVQQAQPQTSPLHLLDLGNNLTLEPDILIGNGNGIFAAGSQGSGKSVILKRILEEVSAKANVPIVAFDKEDDLKAVVEYFPRGMVATARNCPTARDIYADGLQVVYDLSTWPNMDAAGQFIARLVFSLMIEADSTPFNLRVPLMVTLDEASYWLPQNRKVSQLADETLSSLHNAFESLASRGRKRGLVPALFTQKFSHIAKEVLSPGTYILCAQNLHTEKKRYMDYILPVGEFKYFTERQTFQRIGDLCPGEAIVKLANGEQVVSQFHECRSEHVARTPLVQAARNRYGHAPFEPHKHYGGYIEDEEMDMSVNLVDSAPIQPAVVQQPDSKYAHIVVDMSLSKEGRVRCILQQNSSLRGIEVAKLADCDPGVVSRVRKLLAAGEPAIQKPARKIDKARTPVYRQKQEPDTVESCISAALDADSGLSPMELASKFGCDLEIAKQARMAYFTLPK